jgi:hypothetical protein
MGLTWSHSALKGFETCALQYHEVKVLKRYPFTDTVHTIYGKELHSAAENYFNGFKLPEQFAFLKPVLDALMAKPGRKLAEYEMGVTADLQPCDFHSDTRWVRGIADLLIIDDDNLTARVVDFKSGSDKYPDTDQLTLMSLMVFVHFPHIRSVNSALFFVLKQSMIKQRMDRSEADAAWWRYRERVAKLEAAYANDVWNPTQSGLCRRHCVVLHCPLNGRN